MKPKENPIYPTGWHYLTLDGIRIDSIDGTLAGTYKAVERFRAVNGLPMGNVIEDVDAYLCTKNPHWCNDAGAQMPQGFVVQSALPAFTENLISWGKGLTNQPLNYVTLYEATQRADICAACPLNTEWQKTGCSSCIDNAKRLFLILRRNLRTNKDNVLGGCLRHKWENSVAVWLESSKLQSSEPCPDNCWFKK